MWSRKCPPSFVSLIIIRKRLNLVYIASDFYSILLFGSVSSASTAVDRIGVYWDDESEISDCTTRA